MGTLLTAAGVHGQDAVPLNIAAIYNWEQPNRGFGTFPTGATTLLDMPFAFGSVEHYQWNSHYASGENPRTAQISVDAGKVERVWLIANTYWGQPLAGLHMVEFVGSGGSYYLIDLVGNDDIRDFSESGWTGDINGVTTQEAWSNGTGQRLDAQIIELPVEFHSDTLETITFYDYGGETFARMFVCAVTLEVSECKPDISGDGYVDTRDVLQFLALWIQRDPFADWDENGTINSHDVMVFLNDWVVGC